MGVLINKTSKLSCKFNFVVCPGNACLHVSTWVQGSVHKWVWALGESEQELSQGCKAEDGYDVITSRSAEWKKSNSRLRARWQSEHQWPNRRNCTGKVDSADTVWDSAFQSCSIDWCVFISLSKCNHRGSNNPISDICTVMMPLGKSNIRHSSVRIRSSKVSHLDPTI